MDNNVMDNIENGSRKKIIKFLVPLIFILIIAGIWLVKDAKNDNAPITENNPDFALHAQEDFDLAALKAYGLPIIIDFGADYCQPCKEMAPILEELNREMRGKAIIKFVDTEKYYSIAENYPLRVIPTQAFYDADGKPFVPKNADAYGMIAYSEKDSGEHVFTIHEGGLTKEQLKAIIAEMEAN